MRQICSCFVRLTDAPPSAAERFALIIEGLCRVVAASHARGVAGFLIILIWRRLRRTAARFATLSVHVHAGTLPSRARAGSRHCEARSAEAISPSAEAIPQGNPSRPASPCPPRLPRTFGWLIRLIPGVACCRSQLNYLLSDPEIASLLSAAPQIGRVLHPLCHMLAIKPSPDLLARGTSGPLSQNFSPPPRTEQEPTTIARCEDPAPANAPPANTQVRPPRPLPDPLQAPLLPRPLPA